jgi:hypothetical protein
MPTNETPKNNPRNVTSSRQQLRWLWISGFAFLLCIAAVCGLLFFGNRLENLGIVGNIYYIILIPLGFSAAAFLSGAMKSYAKFTSNESLTYGKLTLAGPIVVFALVVVGGFILPKWNDKEQQFIPRFRIVSENAKTSDFVKGTVTLSLPDQPSIILDLFKGEVAFPNIPIKYLHKPAKVSVDIENYELADSGDIELSKEVHNIKVARTDLSTNTTVRGTILNQNDQPLANAFLNFGSGLAKVTTDENGDFELKIPKPAGEIIRLNILQDGVLLYSNDVTLSQNPPMLIKVKAKL